MKDIVRHSRPNKKVVRLERQIRKLMATNERLRRRANSNNPDAKMGDICTKVCLVFGIYLTDLKGSSRLTNVVNARKVATLIGRECGNTFHEIGKAICRDHTTVMNSMKKAANHLETENEFREMAHRVRESLGLKKDQNENK
jgi:chromosomal replication initiation ATPase DnaA